MNSVKNLPSGYKEIMTVNLQKNKKLAFGINAAAVIVMVIMAVVMHLFVPVSTFLGTEGDSSYLTLLLKLIAALAGYLVYIILHELTHAVAMKAFGTKKVKFGYTGLYAFAGSDDYYTKGAYIIIALAPIVVWGIVLGVLNLLVPIEWFWAVYFIQMGNISGAAGDIYVTAKFMKLPEDILVHDSGVDMVVYSAQNIN